MNLMSLFLLIVSKILILAYSFFDINFVRYHKIMISGFHVKITFKDCVIFGLFGKLSIYICCNIILLPAKSPMIHTNFVGH